MEEIDDNILDNKPLDVTPLQRSALEHNEPHQSKITPSDFTSVNAEVSEPQQDTMQRRMVAVELNKAAFNRDGYESFEEWSRIYKILNEIEASHGFQYEVWFGDNHKETLSLEELWQTPGGQEALARFQEDGNISEDSEISETNGVTKTSTWQTLSKPRHHSDYFRRSVRSAWKVSSPTQLSSDQTSSEDLVSATGASGTYRGRTTRSTRSMQISSEATDGRRTRSPVTEDNSESSDDSEILLLKSDIVSTNRKRKRKRSGLRDLRTQKRVKLYPSSVRHSERATRAQKSMQEIEIDNIYRSDSSDKAPVQPKVSIVPEIFHPGLSNSPFRRVHNENCETCGRSSSAAPLICCQGCSLTYHKACLGNRTGREHLVTKIGAADFVLQCRRCINFPRKKDHLAPSLNKCQICQEPGPACNPFRNSKTAMQEQKERDENGGEDPITPVNSDLINNANSVLFRCVKCWRGFHFYCLPNRNQYHQDLDSATKNDLAENRHNQYCSDWICKSCVDMPAEVGELVAWRPTDIEVSHSTTSAVGYYETNEEDKEYLIKWKESSYARSEFMPGAWVWGVTAPTMRVAFGKRETGPKLRIEDAIPEEFLRIDIVLDVEYSNRIDIRTEEIDKARIKEVRRVYIKYKGLGYEDAVWEVPPTPDEGERWIDFVTAYNDWVLGRWVKLPKQSSLRARIEKAREQPFSKLEKEKQPAKLVGGEMMKYQIEGLNWLYYRWHQKQNGILADEMGLGKTIQVIAFLTMMLEEHNCCPFLIVVPNSICPNWRREIKKWVPSLRVVTFFGTSAARDIASRYELFPENAKDLKAHVVVTSYEAAIDDNCRRFFKSIQWQGLIVDEGQRLKNDQSMLHIALKTLKVPYRILLTGTPLQNNAKELFNLLEFLDDSINAAQLEQEYEDMNEANIRRLHELIRPFILRRTKAGVLGFLPPMAQIILPVSMSVVQRKVYMSILAKNPDLLKSLFSRGSSHELKKTERTNLNNILMQLRKCLCHPFVYSRKIEERDLGAALSHRNLVEASAKLQLLDVLLPKLRERGHRVLIFSQFLDMLDIVEDFLDGLGMKFNRLDGTISSLEKQKRIDQFNQDGSDLFAFLLSTRSGGVGINLATADTVIILDPDFNPHQDVQALSRAHRIGQKKKVLCFQLMTRSSAEEKIMQIGRKKMALDHVIVEQMDADEADEKDLESILRYGAAELFTNEDNEDQHIKYDNTSVERLLDRSQVENTELGEDKTAESQYSFARVWANNSGVLEENIRVTDEEAVPDPFVWDKLLKERERAAAAEAAAREQVLGRGKRARMMVDYGTENGNRADEQDNMNLEKTPDASNKKPTRKQLSDDSDTDFQPEDNSPAKSSVDASDPIDFTELQGSMASTASIKGIARHGSQAQGVEVESKTLRQSAKNGHPRESFQRAQLLPPRLPQLQSVRDEHQSPRLSHEVDHSQSRRPMSLHSEQPIVLCPGCSKTHHQGSCPLKVAGVEYCNLCGLAHFGIARTCPHINSETQVILMIEAVKNSREPPQIREAALKYLRGVKGTLVQKKKNREMAHTEGSVLAHMKESEAGISASMAGAATPPQFQITKHALGEPSRTALSREAVQEAANPSGNVEQRLLRALRSTK